MDKISGIDMKRSIVSNSKISEIVIVVKALKTQKVDIEIRKSPLTYTLE